MVNRKYVITVRDGNSAAYIKAFRTTSPPAKPYTPESSNPWNRSKGLDRSQTLAGRLLDAPRDASKLLAGYHGPMIEGPLPRVHEEYTPNRSEALLLGELEANLAALLLERTLGEKHSFAIDLA